MSLHAFITFQIALQGCMGLQIISRSKRQDLWNNNMGSVEDMWRNNMDSVEDNWKKNMNNVEDMWKKNMDSVEDMWKINMNSVEDKWKNNKKSEKLEDPLGSKKLEDNLNNVKLQNLTSVTSKLDASCSCGKVLISSLGPAANFQPQAMGTYTT